MRKKFVGAHEIFFVFRIFYVAIDLDCRRVLHRRLYDDASKRLFADGFMFHIFILRLIDANSPSANAVP